MYTETMKSILEKFKTVHIMGLSPKPDRASHRVGKYLQENGYEIICIRPNTEEVLGSSCYDSLADAPGPIDVVDVFRASEFVPEIVEAAIHAGAKVLWLQEGVSHPEAEKKAQEAGMTVISDRCIKKAHSHFFGPAT